jgi:hypothetical protein
MTNYERLIKDFCALTGLLEPAAIACGSPIDVDGVTCSIAASHQRDADAFVLYVEFGAVPTGIQTDIFEELLTQNYLGAPETGVSFGYSRSAQHVICSQQLRASEVNAQRLIEMLQHIASKAIEWRRSYFLESVDGRPRSTPSRVSGGTGALLAGGRLPGRARAS